MIDLSKYMKKESHWYKDYSPGVYKRWHVPCMCVCVCLFVCSFTIYKVEALCGKICGHQSIPWLNNMICRSRGDRTWVTGTASYIFSIHSISSVIQPHESVAAHHCAGLHGGGIGGMDSDLYNMRWRISRLPQYRATSVPLLMAAGVILLSDSIVSTTSKWLFSHATRIQS